MSTHCPLKLALSIGVFIVLSTQAFAQQPLDLAGAVALALERNRSLQAAGHDRDAATWGKWSAVSNFLPKVEVAAGVTRLDPETVLRSNAAVDFIKALAGPLGIPASYLSEIRPFAYRDTYETQFTVVQPIYNGGAEIVGLQAANAVKERSELLLADTEQDVIARTAIAYYTVLKVDELVALAKESEERNQRYLDLTRRRAAMGMRTQTDVLRWEVQVASSEGSRITAENALAMAKIQLNDILGVDLRTPYVLAPVAKPDSTTPVLPSAAVVDTGFLASHPSMKAMEASLRLADVGVNQSWTNFQPKINLAFQYGWEKNNTMALDGYRPWAIALSISYPLFNGFGDFAGVEKARYEYRRTEVQAESYRQGLVMQATNASLSLRAARQRMETARKAQREATDILNAVTRRYETGGASNVDLIDVHTAYTSARTDFITAAYDFLIAQVELDRATGVVKR